MLNECGDTSLTWTPDRDDEVERIIEKKMREGCAFFVIEERGLRSPVRNVADITRTRHLAIPDEDFLKFVESGSGQAVETPKEPVRGARRTKSAKEVARSQSVGVRQRAGG
jgi:hypothetical protein